MKIVCVCRKLLFESQMESPNNTSLYMNISSPPQSLTENAFSTPHNVHHQQAPLNKENIIKATLRLPQGAKFEIEGSPNVVGSLLKELLVEKQAQVPHQAISEEASGAFIQQVSFIFFLYF
jgi:hypothetical protein